MDGYDLDGVITTGRYIPKKGDVIITGRCYQEARETYLQLHGMGVYNCVYFQPCDFFDKTLESSGHWKLKMCKELGIDTFYEDNDIQATILEKGDINVIRVNG